MNIVKFLIISFCITLVLRGFSQNKPANDLSGGNYVITNTTDTLNQQERMVRERQRAEDALRLLRSKGGLIVRLKTNDKSVEAYRKAGKEDIANRIVEDRKKTNQKIYAAFVKNFNFCPVYFIYAKDTRDFLSGKKGLLLNADLEYDPLITLKDTFFVIAQQGTATANADLLPSTPAPYISARDKPTDVLGQKATEGTGSTGSATENAVVFLDKDLKQYYRPFPFAEGVYLDNYTSSAKALNNQFYRAYNRLVYRGDMKEEQKRIKREQKAKLKASPPATGQ